MAKIYWKPSEEYIEKTNLFLFMRKLDFTSYEHFYKKSTENVEWFWNEVIKDLDMKWFRPFDKTLDLSKGMPWPQWFVNGSLNVVENAIDKWVNHPEMKQKEAIIWEGEDGSSRAYTYQQLFDTVNRIASGLKKEGIGRGDCVALYMPMIPEAVIAMLAISKIGAIYTPIFSGYGADALLKRIEACQAKMLITADGFLRRNKKIEIKKEADHAVSHSKSIEKVVVVHRFDNLNVPWHHQRDIEWSSLLQTGQQDPDHKAETAWMKSDEPMMIIYTSGTTGKPKGIVHTHSGLPTKMAFDARYGMDIHRNDRLCWLTDMGWIMGPFVTYGTLLNGATMVLYEGAPDYPYPNRIWQMVGKHKVTHLGISPTLIRSIIPYGEKWVRDEDLSCLKVIGSTGEPWNEDPWIWLFEKVGKGRIPIFNYSGGTEVSGGILGNVFVKPIVPTGFNCALPGMDADVFSSNKEPVRGELGELVLKQPWVGMANGFWNEPQRYEQTYWERWSDCWVHGDLVKIDNEGHWFISGRSDDMLNVAGKRLGPVEIESILVEHEEVVEAAVIGVPDDIKGEVPVAFVVVNKAADSAMIHTLIQEVEQKLGKALRLKTIYIVSELPKTRNGKIMRRIIRAAYLNQDIGDVSALENQTVLDSLRNIKK